MTLHEKLSLQDHSTRCSVSPACWLIEQQEWCRGKFIDGIGVVFSQTFIGVIRVNLGIKHAALRWTCFDGHGREDITCPVLRTADEDVKNPVDTSLKDYCVLNNWHKYRGPVCPEIVFLVLVLVSPVICERSHSVKCLPNAHCWGRICKPLRECAISQFTGSPAQHWGI